MKNYIIDEIFFGFAIVLAVFVLCKFISCAKYETCIRNTKDAKSCAELK
jgi:hypothetical protein